MFKCKNCSENSKFNEPSFLIYEYKINEKGHNQIKSQKRVCKICWDHLTGREIKERILKTTGVSLLSQSQIISAHPLEAR